MTKTMHTHSFIENARGKKMFHQSWAIPQAKAAIVLVHGVGEHSGRYAEFAHAMNANGIAVHSFDLEGFGNSEGKRGHIDHFSYYAQDVKLFLDYVQTEIANVDACFIMGHSLGALIALETVHMYSSLNLAGIILSGPPFKLNLSAASWYRKMASFFSGILPALTFEERSISINMLTHDEEKKAAFLNDPHRHYHRSLKFLREFFRAERKVFDFCESISMPVMLIQGGEDTIIDVKQVQEFYSKIPHDDKTLIIYPDMYHEVLNEVDRQRVFSDVIKWISDHTLVQKEIVS